MSIIDGHTCIGDDGGTPNRKCDACVSEQDSMVSWEQRAREQLATRRIPTGSDLHLLEMALAEVDRLRGAAAGARSQGRSNALYLLASAMRKVLAPESVKSLVDVLQVAILQNQAEGK